MPEPRTRTPVGVPDDRRPAGPVIDLRDPDGPVIDLREQRPLSEDRPVVDPRSLDPRRPEAGRPESRRRPSGGGATTPPAPETWVDRVIAPPDVDGPRVRLGFLWVLVLLPALALGAPGLAVVFATVAGFAGHQVASAWTRAGRPADPWLAAAGAAVVPLLALAWPPLAVAALLVALPIAALAMAASLPEGSRGSLPAAAGRILGSVVPAAVAGLGVVAVAHRGLWPAVVLVLLVCAYDAGHFTFGAEARTPVPGIVAGMVCTAIAAVPVLVLQLPFDGWPEFPAFAGLVAVTAPLGHVVASLSLPAAATRAGALRRLDSFIVAAPLWAVALAATAV